MGDLEDKNKQESKETDLFFNLVPDMLCIASAEDGYFKELNPAWEKTLGFTREELLSKPLIEFIHPDDRSSTMSEVEKQLKGQPTAYFENRYICKDGSYRWLSWTATPAKGNLLYATARDITEYKRAERKLQESENKFRSITENAVDYIFIKDMTRRYTFVNQAMKEMLGLQDEEILGKTPEEIFGPEQGHIVEEVDDRTFSGKIVNETRSLVIGDKELFFNTLQTPLTMEDSEVTSIMGIVRDVSRLKKLEEEGQKIHKLESIGILAGGIAHDFNNLLAAIRNNIYLAMMHVDRENIAYENLESTENIIHIATNLTQQLLTFSKGGTPVKKTASIIELIKESAEFVLKGSNAKYEYNVADNIWPVEVDEGQINQVIHNLILNANQSMPDGGTMLISTENSNLDSGTGLPLEDGRYVKIAIQDEGIGIAKEHLQKLFDPYFTTKEMERGLGLSITYSIIKNHDGHISVESELGVGTTFTIYLPASEKQIEGKETVEDTFVAGEGKVLIMDDEEIIRDSVGQLLTYMGYEVECAKDGEEAIELYKKAMEASKPFNAVILDLTIRGGMGGKEVVKKLREIDPDVKAIVTSGYSNDPVLSNFREYGFCGVFAKHDKTEELSKTLHKVIKGYQCAGSDLSRLSENTQ